MDSFKNRESLDVANVDAIQAQVVQVSKNIYATLAVNDNKTKAQMKLPADGECDGEILALAVEHCLARFFKISLPGKLLMDLKEGTSAKFAVKQQEDLPPVTVVVFLDSKKVQQLLIQGVAPENGINGYSVLVFQWQQQAGVLDAYGNIDLKKLNKLPGVKDGTLLAKIYLHTFGQPGISCFGERLRQKEGIPIAVEVDRDSVSRTDDLAGAAGESTYELYAKKAGVVKYSLSKDNDPKTLGYIAVNDTIVINGDVDYGVGDQGEMSQPEQGCDSNIIVEGSVRGVFSLQSNGYIHVRDAIEGTVSAYEVETMFITRGSSVTARKKITAGSIINATARSETIIVKENVNGSTLHASGELILEERASCMGIVVNTTKLQAKSSRFSGVNKFIIGEQLFGLVENHSTKLKNIYKRINEYSGPLKEMASTIVDHLALLNSIARKGPTKIGPEVLLALDKIKMAVVIGFKSVGKAIDDNVVSVAYELQALLGKAKLNESVLRKVDLLIKSIGSYNQKAQELVPSIDEMNFHVGQLTELHKRLRNELVLQFIDVELLSDNSELQIYCGEAEQRLNKQDIPGRSFTIRYSPPDDIEALRKGKLQIL